MTLPDGFPGPNSGKNPRIPLYLLKKYSIMKGIEIGVKGVGVLKLIFAIVNKDDTAEVMSALTGEGFSVTKMATTGGFLMSGNTTLLIGAEDSHVDEIISLIEKHSKKRTRMVSRAPGGKTGKGPMELTVGGATIFVTDVERYEKV